MAKVRKFGFEVVVETNTDFREEFFRKFFNLSLTAMQSFGEDKKIKIKWRPLQPDEIPDI